MLNIIEVNDLVLVYSNGTRAVDNISFNVKKGEFFGFLGPNWHLFSGIFLTILTIVGVVNFGKHHHYCQAKCH